MTTKTDCWTDAEGREHEVKTEQGPGQSREAFCEQHDEAVEAAQEIWPPV